MSEPTDAGIVQVRDVDPATLAVLRDRARSLGQSLSGYLRDLMDADAAGCLLRSRSGFHGERRGAVEPPRKGTLAW